MQTAGWRIYYSDGSVVSSLESGWLQAPSEGVQVVVVFYNDTYQRYVDDEWRTENYREVIQGRDYYWVQGVTPHGGTHIDAQEADERTVKLGEALDNEAFQEVYNRALLDRVW